MPAFGFPIKPTSAIIFNSRRIRRTSGSPPGVDSRVCAIGRGFESHIPLASLSPLGNNDLVPFVLEVLDGKTTFRIQHDRSWGNIDIQVGGGGAVPLGALAGLATLRFPVLSMGKRGETIHTFTGTQDHTPATAAIAPIGTAFGDVLFPPEADAAITALAGLDADLYFIDEHGDLLGVLRESAQYKKGMAPE